MSNIPEARTILLRALEGDPPNLRRAVVRALALMTREKCVRRVASKRRKIDKHLRRRIQLLARNTDLTMHEIAVKVGLGSGGRISEVMHGKR